MNRTGPQKPEFEAPIYGSSGPSAPPQPTNPTSNPYTSLPASNDYYSSVSRPPPVEAKTNPLAIASLVTLFFLPVVSTILGFIALKQIKESNGVEKGEGMAIAGIVAGGITLLIVLIGLLGFLGSSGG